MKLADESLFNNVLRFEHHVLNPLLPPTKEHQHNISPRQNDRQFLTKTNTLNSRNFIVRSLYKDIY